MYVYHIFQPDILLVIPFVGFIVPPFLFFRLVLPARWWKQLPADKKPHEQLKRIAWAIGMIALITFGVVFFVVGVYTSIIQDVA